MTMQECARFAKQMAEQFRKGDNTKVIAERFGTNSRYVSIFLKTYMGDEYDTIAREHCPSLRTKDERVGI